MINIASLLLHSGQCKSKIRFLEDLGNSKTLFFALTETFLRPEISDSEITMSGFNVVRADRESRVGGGVCLFINSKVIYKTLLKFSNSVCGTVVVLLENPKLLIVNIYRPPSCSVVKFKDALDKIKNWKFMTTY